MNKKINTLAFLFLFIFNLSIAQTITLSGKVLRHNGDPIEGVMVNCTNVSPVLSAVDGSFSFSDLPEEEDFTITGGFETDFFENISILDVAYSGDLILGVINDPLNYQFLAGDMNQSGSVSTVDLVMMRRAILKIDNSYPDIYWKFYDGDTNLSFPTLGIYLQNVIEDKSDLELIGVKTGDVAINADHLPPPPNAPIPVYFIEDISVSQGEQFLLEIKANDFKDIVGFQQGLKWDPSLLEFIEYEGNTDLNFFANEMFSSNGDFLITGISVGSEVDLDNGDVVYAIKFNALQDLTGMEGIIDFSTEMIPKQTVFRAENDWLYLVEDVYNGVTTSLGNIANLEEFELTPNPTFNDVFVKINFENYEEAELSLYDFSGKLIRLWNHQGHTFRKTISLQGLPRGTYAIKLRTNKGLITKKIVKY
jgi:large repetitive protein